MPLLPISPDVALVLGVLLVAFSIPSVLSRLSDGRSPLVGILLAVLGGGLVWRVYATQEAVATLEDVPMAFIRVVGTLLN